MHVDKGVGVRFSDFIPFFLNTPWKWNNLVSLRPNYFIFIGYLKTGARRGVQANPLNRLWIRHCRTTSFTWPFFNCTWHHSCGLFSTARGIIPVAYIWNACGIISVTYFQLHVTSVTWPISNYTWHHSCTLFPTTRGNILVDCFQLHLAPFLYPISNCTWHQSCGVFPTARGIISVSYFQLHVASFLWIISNYTWHN